MAGYLNFATGQVLTAAQVNGFLMEQATMTFADDAARTTALASVLREGLLTYNEDTAQLEIYNGTAWVSAAPAPPAPPAGIGSNVVSVTTTSAFSTSSTSFVDVTGLTATITPTTNTSKILVIAHVSIGMSGTVANFRSACRLLRDTTVIGASGGNNMTLGSSGDNRYPLDQQAIGFLDSPSTTSATIYHIEAKSFPGGHTTYINRNGVNTLQAASSITLIEVAP